MAEPTDDTPDLSEAEIEALHSVELGLEWLNRAHGKLVEFHHSTGHAMDHLYDAEAKLRDAGHEAFADRLRDELLPKGAVEDRWTYDLLETFEAGLHDDVRAFERQVRDDVADGRRHVAERRQESEWTSRAGRD
jgi:hypothetical protein